MLIYQGTKKEFKEAIFLGTLTEQIEKTFRDLHIFGGSDGEARAWMNSLPRMKDILDTPDIPDDVRVAIEYQIPTTGKRVDFMIEGEDAQGHQNIVMVELKQWDRAYSISEEECIKAHQEESVSAYTGGAERMVQHPCAQISNYAKLIQNLCTAVGTYDIHLYPLAYLHNYREDARAELEAPQYAVCISEAPLFLSKDNPALRDYICARIVRPAKRNLFEEIENGKLKPSVALQDAILPMLEGKKEFYLLDEQQTSFATIHKTVKDAERQGGKYTIVVQGGPGTGKSVIAVQLLTTLLSERYSAAYVTKNSAPREVFSSLLVQGNKKMAYIRGLFKGSGSFVGEQVDRFDCLLVDEAHRLRAKSGMYENIGENQIMEIIQAAKVSVFFLDEDQIVTSKDIGTMEEIRKWANFCGSTLLTGEHLILKSQFRCNGSDGYLAWVDNALQIRPTANFNMDGLDYELRVYTDPNRMREDLRARNQGSNKARMLAGYCYPWNSKKDPGAVDIRLPHGFEAQWNFASTKTWAIDEDSFDQVGCIHTSQGLEFDYVGVILGKDICYRNGKIITDFTKRAKSDSSVKGLKSRTDAEEVGDRIVKDTYKTLMTRGRNGCYLYCEDQALADYFVALGAKKID